MKRLKTLAWITAMVALTGVVLPGAARAAGELPADWVPLAPEALDEMRGGFEMPSGLVLSLGIERVAFVNGDLVASSHISIPNITQLSSQDAAALSQLTGTTLVQVGEGNRFDAAGLNGLVIQNTLDGQHISATTTISVNVNTLDLFQSLNLSNTLQNALQGMQSH